MIDVDKQNINAYNLTDCADINISDNVVDGFIATAINAGDSIDFFDDAAGGFISAINAGDLTDCADPVISDDAADEFIATAINGDYLMDCADNAAGGLIDDIDAAYLTDYTDLSISDYAADELIAADSGDSTECDDAKVSEDAVDGLMMLMG